MKTFLALTVSVFIGVIGCSDSQGPDASLQEAAKKEAVKTESSTASEGLPVDQKTMDDQKAALEGAGFKVLWTKPGNGDKEVPPEMPLGLRFNKAVDLTSLEKGLRIETDGVTVPFKVSAYPADEMGDYPDVAVVKPDSPWIESKDYTVSVTTEARSAEAVPLSSEHSWTFKAGKGIKELADDPSQPPSDVIVSDALKGKIVFHWGPKSASLGDSQWIDMLHGNHVVVQTSECQVNCGEKPVIGFETVDDTYSQKIGALQLQCGKLTTKGVEKTVEQTNVCGRDIKKENFDSHLPKSDGYRSAGAPKGTAAIGVGGCTWSIYQLNCVRLIFAPIDLLLAATPVKADKQTVSECLGGPGDYQSPFQSHFCPEGSILTALSFEESDTGLPVLTGMQCHKILLEY